jgi:mannose-1-phosphate guanylyltransferase
VAWQLLLRGCWWNSFVLVGRVPAFLATIWHAAPGLFQAFASIRAALHSPAEEAALGALYRQLPSVNFSWDVLMTRPANLAALPVSGVTWSDLGEPGRVLGTLGRAGIRPAWDETLGSNRLSTIGGAMAAHPA